ncbi:hypothetical protein K3556_05975 [Aliiroseovarius sp. M344]|nr:hypothetical protein [Aliiroseovarius sp. M344]UWQ15433.1 hypothetical protein K3556_05975 [Aliiroseovarius sp. M344]
MNRSFPTHDEIEAIRRQAEQMRAEAVGRWLRAAVNWIKHPGFGHRHA